MRVTSLFTVWELKADIEVMDFIKGEGISTFREIKGVYDHLVMVTTTGLQIDQVKNRFVQFKRAGRGSKCRSLKLFLEGQVPDLSFVGLEQNGAIWSLYSAAIDVNAVPFGKNEWCFMIEKRDGTGVHLKALDVLPYTDYQIQWMGDTGV